MNSKQAGTVEVKIYNDKGKSVTSKKLKLEIAACGKTEQPLTLKLPKTTGGYLEVSELTLPETGKKNDQSQVYPRGRCQTIQLF